MTDVDSLGGVERARLVTVGKPSRRIGTCAFCGVFGRLTREDFTPKWLSRYINTHLPPKDKWQAVEIRFGGDRPYRERSRIVGGASAIKPVIVCAPCNNGWMAKLEQAVQPILGPMVLGQPVDLDAAALYTLATWATKTALVFELVQQDGSTTASTADRKWFSKNRQPLTGSRIWIARYVGTFGTVVLARSTLFTYDLDDATPVSEPNGLVVTLAYGEVAFRVAMVRSAPTLPTRIAVAEQSHTPTIWPASGPLEWPPTVALDDEGLRNFGAVGLPVGGPGALDRYGPPA